MKIKTFRPEISIVDIMIAKVSFCLLPLGGDGDDGVLSVRSCSAAELQLPSFYHICIPSPPQSSQTQTNLPIHLPCRVGDNGTDGPSNHPLLTPQSSQEAILCVLELDCHIVSCHTFKTVACNSQGEDNTIVSAISYEQGEPSPSPSSTESNDLPALRTENLAEKPTILVIKSVRGIWQVSREE